LPAPQPASNEAVYSPPCTPIEMAIADIWAEVLNAGRVGIDDNFFDLGGHSLLAVQLLNRINRALGSDLTMRQLFATPTVAGLSLAASAKCLSHPASTPNSG
jgi:acyl carrier protein